MPASLGLPSSLAGESCRVVGVIESLDRAPGKKCGRAGALTWRVCGDERVVVRLSQWPYPAGLGACLARREIGPGRGESSKLKSGRGMVSAGHGVWKVPEPTQPGKAWSPFPVGPMDAALRHCPRPRVPRPVRRCPSVV